MKSLRVRLALTVGVLLAGATAMALALVFSIVRENLVRDLDTLVRDKAWLLSRATDPANPAKLLYSPKELEEANSDISLQVLRPNGGSLYRELRGGPAPSLTEEARRECQRRLVVFLETQNADSKTPTRVATVPVTRNRREPANDEIVAFAQAAVPVAARGAALRRIIQWLVGGGAVLTVAGVAAAWLIGSHFLRELEFAAETARSLTAQNLLRQRLSVPSGGPELARLTQAFNELLDRIDSLYSVQQRFVADASHELRTPLTVLRSEIEVALRHERSAPEYRAVLQSNREELERLSRLVENLLALARVDAGENMTGTEPVELGAICWRVAEKLSNIATERNVALTVDAPEPVIAKADRISAERVIANLVENALRYTPDGESVTVSVGADGVWAKISVSDTGCGIAAEHLPRIFDRFYRIDSARSRQSGGAGLGLAIVRALVEAQGGVVEVASELGAGTTFSVRLPAA